jgi:hypothetical protein
LFSGFHLKIRIVLFIGYKPDFSVRLTIAENKISGFGGENEKNSSESFEQIPGRLGAGLDFIDAARGGLRADARLDAAQQI